MQLRQPWYARLLQLAEEELESIRVLLVRHEILGREHWLLCGFGKHSLHHRTRARMVGRLLASTQRGTEEQVLGKVWELQQGTLGATYPRIHGLNNLLCLEADVS